ncbi:MAG: hypothetical protein L3J74_08070 [Bacteroidales bacterium]|nr:hypothetical protein [Bacteroidales bacterium]
MFDKILLYFFRKRFYKKKAIIIRGVIDMYRTSVRERFLIKAKIVNVKKGKIRYRIAIMEDENFTYKIYISRHKDNLSINLYDTIIH